MSHQPRRWDRSELATLLDYHLTLAAALEQWINGDGLGQICEIAPAPTLTPVAALPLPHHKGDLSGPELARVLGISKSVVSQWIRQGVLKGYLVQHERSGRGAWMVPIDEAREVVGFTSALRTAKPRISDRSVAIATSKHLRRSKGIPPAGRKGRKLALGWGATA